MTGLYVVLEGMDKAGKSTLARNVVETLKEKGRDVVWVNEPFSGSEEFLTLRKLITDGKLEHNTKALIALASRIELYQQVIKPALDRGCIVISERNFISTLIYQGQDNPAPIHNIHLNTFEQLGIDLSPDMVVTLEIDYDTFKTRSIALGDLDGIEQYLLKQENFEAYRSRYVGCVKMATQGTKTQVVSFVNQLDLIANIEARYQPADKK